MNLLQNFADINSTFGDHMMAVGPSTVVGAATTAITLTNKSGGARQGPIGFDTFFSSIYGGGRFNDPYVLYDDQANRFYVGILEGNSLTGIDSLDFAISKTSTPTKLGSADWTVFPKITSVNESNTLFPDF